MTLAQFDSEDPFEVLIDGVDLTEVRNLRRADYRPRSMTPLFDAVGRMIGRVDADIARRADRELDKEDQVVVIVTDGLENASSEHDRASVFAMVEERRARDWVFVFLGANQDAYAEGAGLGVAAGATAGWAASPTGVKKMWKDLGYSTRMHRKKTSAIRAAEAAMFYEEEPEEKDDE